jgi:hypothetical protein
VPSGEGPNGISFSPLSPAPRGEVMLDVPRMEGEPTTEDMKH